VECPYHGWKFDQKGDCKAMPSTRMCKGISVDSLPIEEKDGLIWLWNDGGAQSQEDDDLFSKPTAASIPNLNFLVDGEEEGFTAELSREIAVDYTVLVESLQHIAYEPIRKLPEITQNLPWPEQLTFHASRLLAGDLIPSHSPSEKQEEASAEGGHHRRMGTLQAAPGVYISSLELKEGGGEKTDKPSFTGGKVHQMHSIVPIRPGYSRLLYRMSVGSSVSGSLSKILPASMNLWQNIATNCFDHGIRLVEEATEIY